MITGDLIYKTQTPSVVNIIKTAIVQISRQNSKLFCSKGFCIFFVSLNKFKLQASAVSLILLLNRGEVRSSLNIHGALLLRHGARVQCPANAPLTRNISHQPIIITITQAGTLSRIHSQPKQYFQNIIFNIVKRIINPALLYLTAILSQKNLTSAASDCCL